MPVLTTILLLAVVLPATMATPAPPPAAESLEALQISGQAFGGEVVMAVADLPPASGEEALRRALEEIRRVEELTDPDGQQPGGLGRLNAAAGGGELSVEPELARLLVRALYFCRWSDGANGPLGGHLYRRWAPAGEGGAPPPPEALAPALAAAGCRGLAVDAEAGAAALGGDRRLDLRDFAAGHAADRAAALLQDAGAGNGFVKVGGITRAFGPGPGGRGWPVTPPSFPGLVEPLEQIWLRDQALAIAARGDGGPAGAPRSSVPYIDQRRGRPAEGVVATLAVTELGVDAQGLATTLFIIGSRNGQLLLGGLRPRPSVLWLLGSGTGHPLLVDYRWSEVGR